MGRNGCHRFLDQPHDIAEYVAYCRTQQGKNDNHNYSYKNND
jgi:hypothetical protein